MKRQRGFTLIEIIIAVTIVSVLAGIISIKAIDVGRKSRDADRQADLRTLQSAVELYKQKNGRYPAACNGQDAWSGQAGTSYACASGNQYIVGLAPEFMPSLPKDPKLNGVDSGYVYRVNPTGTAFKILAFKTVESETITNAHSFKPCDVTDNSLGICDITASQPGSVWGGSTPTECQNSKFTTSYGVWGGFPNEPFAGVAARSEEQVENTICRMP